MVSARPVLQCAAFTFVLTLCTMSASHAAVVASVDRERVEQNESFSLELTADTTADISPDLSVLDQDFQIGATSRLSNTTLIGGQIQRSTTWTITLMPKRSGTLTIPPIRVGTEESNPLTIVVSEPKNEPPGEADVFITADVDADEAFVQAQLLYTIRIYRAVATRQHALREPTFSGAEVLVELAGDEKNYEAVLNGRAYDVVERTFAVFPQESGEVQISPARFEARVLRDGRITGRKVFDSEAKTIRVKPIPPPPADYPDAAWLPARDLEISDEWSRDAEDLRAGEPISRSVTVSVLGQLETQIPVLEPPQTPGVNVYPDKPVLTRRVENGGIRGVRRDQYAMIGTDAGTVTLPGLELPWWDIAAGEWRVARVPPRTVTILPGDIVPKPQPTPVAERDAATATVPQPEVVHSPSWRRAAEILAALWLLTLFAWWWSSRPPRDQRPPQEVPVYRRQAQLLKRARKAAVAGDPRGTREAMLEWAGLQWPNAAPRSIGALASQVSAPLDAELRKLSRVSYGQGDTDWDGTSFARALRSFAVDAGEDTRDAGGPLPPLVPDTR